MLATSRERVLEKKIVTLEQRLVLVERFVEMRFCETFRDFQIRNNISSTQSNDENSNEKSTLPNNHISTTGERNETPRVTAVYTIKDADSPSTLLKEYSPPSTNGREHETTSGPTSSGRKSKRLAEKTRKTSDSSTSSASKTSGTSIPSTARILKVSVPRLEEIPENVGEISRSQTEAGLESTVIKVYYETDDMGEGEESGNCEEDGGERDYFTFPSGGDSEEGNSGETSTATGEDDPFDRGTNDPTDEDWHASSRDDDENEEDYVEIEKPKSTRPTPTPWKRRKVSQKNRKKPIVVARQDLLPEGARVESLNPSATKECPLCHRHYKSDIYEQHLEIHGKERHLKCPFCDKRFFTNKNLYQHKRTHQVEKYGKSCRLCSKVFVEPYKVLSHERFCIRKRLEDNIPVDPDIIEDVRERSKNVDLKWPNPNEKIPEGMKKCGRCKRYIAEDLFLSHVNELHSSWKCSTCNTKFTLKKGLVRHLCRYHGENRVTCDICSVTFESRKDYRNHLSKCPEGGRRNLTRRLKNQKAIQKLKDGENDATECDGKSNSGLVSNDDITQVNAEMEESD